MEKMAPLKKELFVFLFLHFFFWATVQVCGCDSSVDWQSWRFCQWWHLVSCCAVCYKQWGFTGYYSLFFHVFHCLSPLLEIYSISNPLHMLYMFYQPYAAVKVREYIDKPAIHETMVKVCTFFLWLTYMLYFNGGNTCESLIDAF